MKVTPLTLRRKVALELNRHLNDKIKQEHSLRQLFWECTLRCNLNCRHCGSDCKKTSGTSDMPLADFLKVLDSIAKKYDPHKVFVIISGGEPLMRQDLEECGLAIYKKGFPWGMVTNGYHLTQERLNQLLRSGLHSISVSLDGFEKEHNWMRGNEKSFERANNAIKMLCSVPDLVFDVVTCVNKQNIFSLEQLKSHLINMGVKRWRIFTIIPMGRAALDPELQLSNEDFRSVLEFIKSTRKEGKIRLEYGCEGFLGNYEGDVRNKFFSCHAGINVGSVLINGDISACTSIRSNYSQGNIYKDDFLEVWENCFHPYRNREWMKKGECADCSYFKYCQGNGMHLRDENGELYFCHLKRLKEK
ncbi:MAG: TIGR04133 family radical SAM/SPASM protein [Paludibacteraceae bacterium]|nr:TIGR04133 family radical SAM/SPASM protein [Paludibacteraceae bacterium]